MKNPWMEKDCPIDLWGVVNFYLRQLKQMDANGMRVNRKRRLMHEYLGYSIAKAIANDLKIELDDAKQLYQEKRKEIVSKLPISQARFPEQIVVEKIKEMTMQMQRVRT